MSSLKRETVSARAQCFGYLIYLVVDFLCWWVYVWVHCQISESYTVIRSIWCMQLYPKQSKVLFPSSVSKYWNSTFPKSFPRRLSISRSWTAIYLHLNCEEQPSDFLSHFSACLLLKYFKHSFSMLRTCWFQDCFIVFICGESYLAHSYWVDQWPGWCWLCSNAGCHPL